MKEVMNTEDVDEICRLIEEADLTPKQACDRLGLDWESVREDVEDQTTDIGRRISVSRAKAIQHWTEKLRNAEVRTGEYKAARTMLMALDPNRFNTKKESGESFSYNVYVVDESYLPRMPIQDVLAGEGQE